MPKGPSDILMDGIPNRSLGTLCIQSAPASMAAFSSTVIRLSRSCTRWSTGRLGFLYGALAGTLGAWATPEMTAKQSARRERSFFIMVHQDAYQIVFVVIAKYKAIAGIARHRRHRAGSEKLNLFHRGDAEVRRKAKERDIGKAKLNHKGHKGTQRKRGVLSYSCFLFFSLRPLR